jgi:transcriptional regulator GlxA family with amidase domain
MTNMSYFLPMSHTVAFLVYPGFQLLDASGPASVFGEANHVLGEGGQRPFYSIEMISPEGGPVTSSCGVAIQTRALSGMRPARVDTLLIAGAEAEELRAAIAEPAVRRWVPRCAKTAARFGSVCSGAFVLAAVGLLDGKRVATHWDACAPLAALFPSISVDPDTLYVMDGNIWTSAGVSTGIDMALAMVGSDLGSAIASHAAKRLVLYARRPGYQSQFSPLLRAQVKAEDPFAELIGWLQANLDLPLDVPGLAARAGLSERSFYRKFLAATGESPAHFIETVRLDAARMLLSQGRLPLKAIAAQVGLSPPPRLSEAFERRFGVTPRLFREMHTGS